MLAAQQLELAVGTARIRGAAQHVSPGAQVLRAHDVRRRLQHRFSAEARGECDESGMPELDRDQPRFVVEVVAVELGAEQEGVGLAPGRARLGRS